MNPRREGIDLVNIFGARARDNNDDDLATGGDSAPSDAPSFSIRVDPGSSNRTDLYYYSDDPALTDDMDFSRPRTLRARLPDLGLALKTMAAFWSFYFLLVTARAAFMQFEAQGEMFQRRIAVVLGGVVITFCIYLVLRPLARASLPKKGLVAGLVCLPASFIFAVYSYYAFYLYSPLEARYADEAWMEKQMSDLSNAITMISDNTTSWYFFFACWSAFYIAMSYAAQLRASDTRAAAFAREAQEAQLRALRYQINPHFLFNTLNSLSSLILSHRTDVAERMIMNLSTFFRTTLSADPTADVPLEEEIKLQRLYLDIEQARFPDRLKVAIDIPESLRSARVPILILQPVVENAIKYGVAKSRKAVTLSIGAHSEANRLHIEVHDDGDAPAPDEDAMESTGVGLRNVCDRLIARYGAQAGCFHGTDPQGGYKVRIIMPLVRPPAGHD